MLGSTDFIAHGEVAHQLMAKHRCKLRLGQLTNQLFNTPFVVRYSPHLKVLAYRDYQSPDSGIRILLLPDQLTQLGLLYFKSALLKPRMFPLASQQLFRILRDQNSIRGKKLDQQILLLARSAVLAHKTQELRVDRAIQASQILVTFGSSVGARFLIDKLKCCEDRIGGQVVREVQVNLRVEASY